MQQGGQPLRWRGLWSQAPKDLLNQQRVFRYRIGKISNSLAIPPRNKGQPMGDIFYLNVDRCRIQKIQPAAR